jgi:hypothetical protein
MKLPVEMVVTDVATNGDIRYDLQISEIEFGADDSVSSPTADAVKSMLGGLAGTKGTGVVTSRGFIKQADFILAPSASPELRQFLDRFKHSFGHIITPLPDEAVGTGAKWKTTTTLQQNGATLEQVATVELVALEGSVGTLHLSLVHTAPSQKITINGVEAEVKSMKGQGNGDITFDLSHVVPGTQRSR